MDVFLRPFGTVEAVEHATGGVFFGPITQIFDLGVVDGGEPIGVGDWFCLLNKTQVMVKVSVEGVENVGFDIIGCAGSCPEENRGEEGLRFIREVATPGQMLLVLLESGHDGVGVLGFVGVVMEEGLHVDRDQMPPRQCDQISTKKRQVIVEPGKNHKVQYLERRSTLDVGRADLPQFVCLESVAGGGDGGFVFALARHGFLEFKASGDGIRIEVETRSQFIDRAVEKRLVKGHG